ncbi:MAG: hypothetical protein COA47_01865 [Robiginitomaculum sp.]|nr:MAG: hypothetical protein COA47_01865 [Robiginitomaculum sp.]
MNNPSSTHEAPRRSWGWLILFTSSTTLICCALPILLVSLGAGALSAAMFAKLPFLGVLAHHKIWMFLGSGLLLVLAGWSVYRPGRSCPTDPILAKQCQKVDRWNRRFLILSGIVWGIGFSAAYMAAPLYRWLS